jgi:hypothetical protein
MMTEMRLGRRGRSRLNHKFINKTDKKSGLVMIESGDEVKRKAKRNGRKSVFLPAGNVLDNCSYRGVESIR